MDSVLTFKVRDERFFWVVYVWRWDHNASSLQLGLANARDLAVQRYCAPERELTALFTDSLYQGSPFLPRPYFCRELF